MLGRRCRRSRASTSCPASARTRDADPTSLSLQRSGVRIDRDQAAAYARVCGFPEKDTVPLPYPHLLAFPLHMEAMTSPQFPYPAVGTVHVENSITSHRPLHPGEVVDVAVRVSAPRPHAKGTVVDFVAEVRAGDEVVWESTSTYLRRGRGDDSAPAGLALDRAPEGTVEWRLPGDLGPAVRRGVGRPQPDPPLPGDREGAGLPPPDRARHVEPRPLRRGAGEPAAGGGHRRRRLQEADPAARHRGVRPRAGRRRPGVRADPPEGRRPHLVGRAVPVG